MYMYVIVSSIFLTALMPKSLFPIEKAIVISIEGVKSTSGQRDDLTYSRAASDDYEFYETRYKLFHDEYCIVSDEIPSHEAIAALHAPASDSPYVVKAEVIVGENKVDVTEKMTQVVGPMCDFHECPIDFSWLFPYCNGSVHITFNDSKCEIDIKTNTTIDGDSKHVPLMSYLSDSEDE